MRTQSRIYFRTLRFVSMNWAFPFFIGIAVSLFLVAYGETEMLDLLTQAFDESFKSAVQSCAQ